MPAMMNAGHTPSFKIGRIILLVAAALMTLNHITPFYYGAAAACVLGLLLTMRDFFALERQAPRQVA